MIETPPVARKPAEFVGSAKDDLSAFPPEVKIVMGYAITWRRPAENIPMLAAEGLRRG